MTPTPNPALLVVNADDYAYFPGVSRGIVQAHRNGVVTATGILANGTSFDSDVPMLMEEEGLDVGVHLNVTHGRPLTERMMRRLPAGREEFAGKGWFMRTYLTAGIRTDDVAAEWRAQIRRCLDRGLVLRFLNSHEHIHMFPPLFGLIQALAADFGIPYVRFTDARMPRGATAADVVRCALLRGMAALDRRRLVMPAARLLGAGDSGRLSQERLSAVLSGLEAGRVYELMCHPGHVEGTEEASETVRAYHGWEQELACLISEETRAMCHDRNIRLVGFRDLGAREVTP